MPEIFDPNAGAMPVNFAEQQAKLVQQRKIAEFLRKQASPMQLPQGQMVSGHYVKPSWTQALAPLLAQMNARGSEQDADQAEQQFAKQAGQARQQWGSSLPQAIAARPEMQGPVDPSTGSPELEAQPAQPVTTGQVLKKYFEGMQIPGNEKAADAYRTTAVAELTREDQQEEKAHQARLLQIHQNERLVEQGKQRLDQIKLQLSGKLTPEQQIILKKQEDDTKRYIADKSASARLGAAEARAKALGANVKPVSNTVVKTIREKQDTSEGLGQAYSTFKPEYGGVGGAVSSISGTWNPFAGKDSEEAANWWKNYENQAALAERHMMFGTALSKGEKEAWEAATVKKGMNPGVLANNLKLRAELAAKHYNKSLQEYSRLGYPQVLEAFDEQPESYEAMPDKAPVPIAPPTQQLRPVAPPQRRATDRPALPSAGNGLKPGWKLEPAGE